MGAHVVESPRVAAYARMMGLREGFTRDELRRAYLRGCRKLAPDKGGDVRRFDMLQEANAVLAMHARDGAREQRCDDINNGRSDTPDRPDATQLTAAPAAGRRHKSANDAYAALYGSSGPKLQGHGDWLKRDVPEEHRPPDKISPARLNETFERLASRRGYGPGAVSTHVIPGAAQTTVAHALHDADEDFTLGALPDLRDAFRGAL